VNHPLVLVRKLFPFVALMAIVISGCGTTGVAPAPSATSQLSLSSTTLDFGSVVTGTTSSKSVTATANGTASVTTPADRGARTKHDDQRNGESSDCRH